MDWFLEMLARSGRTVLLDRMLKVGADLVSEEGENPEYDRAIYELISDTAGMEIPGEEMETKREWVAHKIALIRMESKR